MVVTTAPAPTTAPSPIVKPGRITLDTLINVSDNAVAQQPTKMGFRAGTQVTVDNALKMMMVKSANDMAVATRAVQLATNNRCAFVVRPLRLGVIGRHTICGNW